MTTAAEQLAKLGVSMAEASAFVQANLANPRNIYEVAKQHGITNAMLGEIAGGYSEAEVEAFFGFHGIDSRDLDPSLPAPGSAFSVDLMAHAPGSLSGTQVFTGLEDYAVNLVIDFDDYVNFDGEAGTFVIEGYGADDSIEIRQPGLSQLQPNPRIDLVFSGVDLETGGNLPFDEAVSLLPASLETLMTLPHPAASMGPSSALVSRNGPSRLTSRTRRSARSRSSACSPSCRRSRRSPTGTSAGCRSSTRTTTCRTPRTSSRCCSG